MLKHLSNRMAIIFAGAGLSWTMMAAHPAVASTFTFKQKDISGNPFLSGTFSGEDTNNDNSLDLSELSDFKLPLDSISLFLDDLSNFTYILGTRESIAFNAEKRLDINDEFVLSQTYALDVDGFVPTSLLGVTTVFQDGSTIVADTFAEDPIRVQAASIPEGHSIVSLIFFGLLMGIQKKLAASSRTMKQVH